MEPLIVGIVVWFFFWGIIGAVVGDRRENAVGGFWWGGMLGPIGIVIVYTAFDNRPQCARCGGRMNRINGRVPDACQHCGAALSASAAFEPLSERIKAVFSHTVTAPPGPPQRICPKCSRMTSGVGQFRNQCHHCGGEI